MSEHTEHRRFTRIPFDATTRLEQKGREWTVHLIDISFKGFLIESTELDDVDPTQPFEARIELSRDATVCMKVELRHRKGTHFGFVCEQIDMRSIEHLRRVIELNLADSTKLEREFHELIEV